MNADHLTMRMPDGCSLFVRRYRALAPAGEHELKGRTLLLVHGACQHGGRFDQAARFFALGGWNVIVPDLRGHGLSGGERTHIDDFSRYVLDLETIHRRLGLLSSRTVLMGHSLGGLLTIRFAQRFPDRLAAATLLSPLLAVKRRIAGWKLRLGRIACALLPRLRFSARITPEMVSRCPKVRADKRLDRLQERTVTGQWFLALQTALVNAWKEAGRVRTPLLVLQAGQDAVVDAGAAWPWVRRTAAADKTLEVVPHALHELLSEPDWPRTAAHVCQWLDRRVPGPLLQSPHGVLAAS